MTFIHRSRHHVPHGKLLGKSTPALLGVWLVTVASFTHIRPGIFFIILIIRILHFSLIILWFWWYLLVRSSTSFSFQGPLGVSVITTQGQKVSISNKKVSNLDLHPNSGNQESQQMSAFFCRSSLAKRWSQPKRSRVSGHLKWTTQVPFSCGPSLHLFTILELYNLCWWYLQFPNLLFWEWRKDHSGTAAVLNFFNIYKIAQARNTRQNGPQFSFYLFTFLVGRGHQSQFKCYVHRLKITSNNTIMELLRLDQRNSS